jgi:hypothetical protein
MSVALIFTHISPHARLEIPMDLRDPQRVFSPSPRFGERLSPSPGRGEQDQKMWVNMRRDRPWIHERARATRS